MIKNTIATPEAEDKDMPDEDITVEGITVATGILGEAITDTNIMEEVNQIT